MEGPYPLRPFIDESYKLYEKDDLDVPKFISMKYIFCECIQGVLASYMIMYRYIYIYTYIYIYIYICIYIYVYIFFYMAKSYIDIHPNPIF